jgi:protein disulfide isomerase
MGGKSEDPEAPTKEGEVYVLSDANYQKFLEETPGHVLVEWYAPWCGHCKALDPEYKKAAEVLSKLEDPKITLAKIDATKHAASAQANGVQGYPTLKIFSDGGKTKKDYKGPRQEAGIISTMKKAAGPPLQVASVAAAQEVVKDGKMTLPMLFLAPDTPDAEAIKAATSKIASKHGDSLDWYLVEAPLEDLEKAFGVTKASFGMVLPEQWHSPHEKAMRLMDASTDEAAIEQHMKDNLLPRVGVLTVDNYMHFFKAGDGQKVVKLISKDAYKKETIAPFTEEFRSVAAKYPKIFFWVEPLQEYTMNQFGFDKEKAEKGPVVGFLDQGSGQKWRMDGDFTATNLEAFVKGVEAGEIAAYSKSEDVPPAANKGMVQKIVGKNFKEFVTDSKQAAFVKFYAPWCGHCKKLAPIWEELAMKQVAGVTIGHFDATANDYVDTQTQGMVQGYPTLLYYSPGKAPEQYNGARELDALAAFVEAKAGGGAAAAPAGEAAGEKEL